MNNKNTFLCKNITIPIIPKKNIYLEMIYVEGGTLSEITYDYGVSEEYPPVSNKEVTVESFYISKYMVTNKLFNSLVNPQNRKFQIDHIK